MTTAELLLVELEEAAKDLMQYGAHDGPCTNEHQMKIAPKIAPCQKHEAMRKAREKRFVKALENIQMFRDVFKGSL